MASRVLYPPIVDSYMPAFFYGGNCRVYFSLSKFNGSTDFKNVQVAVMKQNNGLTVINPVDSEECYRANGRIIINKSYAPAKDENFNNIDNLYYFEITPSDINNGQTVGQIYKIQLRLSSAIYEGDGTDQSTQLNDNASNFSEQSTVCVTKAIGEINLILANPFNYDSSKINNGNSNEEQISTFSISTLEVCGNIVSKDDISEVLYSYQIRLYKNTDGIEDLVEDSGELFSNKYQDSNEFYYLVKRELKDKEKYRFVFDYMTINGYKDTYEKNFEVDQAEASTSELTAITIESDTDGKQFDSSIAEEEEEGRIGIKLIPLEDDEPFSGNLCIRRASEKDNFESQTDIKIIVVNQEYIKNLPIVYDYTIESGVYYKYGVQKIDRDGFRSALNPEPKEMKPVMRDFEYSFLLGEEGKQLRLMFDNTMSNYKIQQLESKLETIGSKYPIVTRNAAVEYKIFPITGLISIQMNEDHLFCTKKDIYGWTDIVDLHTNEDGTQEQYDYIYERDFRKLVLDFLHDGKPKLFKSPTEGNIIVRLTDISLTPNQSLDRMIYSFTANGNELAEATMENYLKYGFYEVGEYATSFEKGEVKIGQLNMDFDKNINIIEAIFDKYSKEKENIAGYSRKIQNIFGIRITINDKPLRVRAVGGSLVLGNNMRVSYNNKGNQIITIYNGIYEFDSRIKFTSKNSESIYLLGSEEDPNKIVNATIDFFYEIISIPYLGKRIESQKTIRVLGQMYSAYSPGSSIYKNIYSKYYIEAPLEFRRLNKITGIEIEANPGAVFLIQDNSGLEQEEHEINTTGLLNIYDVTEIKELIYEGMRMPDGSIDRTQVLTIMVNYHCVLRQGVYKKENE